MADNNQNISGKPIYKNGEKYQYNRYDDTFGNARRYSDETPRRKMFLNNTHKIIFAIVAGLISIASVILCILVSLGYI